MLELLSVICRKGSVHDYRILKESRVAISPETEKLADSGYQGISELYANSSTPIKKCRSVPLTPGGEAIQPTVGNTQGLPLSTSSDGVRFFASPKTSIEANIVTMGKPGM